MRVVAVCMFTMCKFWRGTDCMYVGECALKNRREEVYGVQRS